MRERTGSGHGYLYSRRVHIGFNGGESGKSYCGSLHDTNFSEHSSTVTIVPLEGNGRRKNEPTNKQLEFQYDFELQLFFSLLVPYRPYPRRDAAPFAAASNFPGETSTVVSNGISWNSWSWKLFASSHFNVRVIELSQLLLQNIQSLCEHSVKHPTPQPVCCTCTP